MMKYLLKVQCVLIAAVIVTGIIGACEKTGDSLQTQAASASKTVTAARTTVKTAAGSVTAGGTAAKSTAASASGVTAGTAKGTADDGAAAGETAENEANGDGSVSEGEDEGEVAEVAKVYDLKGRVINVKVAMQSYVPAPDVNKELTIRYNTMKEVEEKYNCRFEYELLASETMIRNAFDNAFMAGVYYADAVRFSRAILPKYEKNNVFLALNDYFDFDLPTLNKYDHINGVIYPDKIYAFFNSTPLTVNAVFYNLEILAREGVPELQEYAENGIWNWGTMLDVAIKTTKDFNGDGIIDQWGIGSSDISSVGRLLLYSNLQPIVRWDGGSNYAYNLNDPKALRALQFMNDIYNTYKVAPAYNTNAVNLFNLNQVTMFLREAWYSYSNIRNKGMTNYGFVELPAGPDNPGNQYMREQGSTFFFYPANITEPEAVINAFSHIELTWDESKSEYMTLEDMLVSGATLYFVREQDMLRYYKAMNEQRLIYDYSNYVSTAVTIVSKNVYTPIGKGETTYSAVDSIKEQVQGIIDETMK